MGRGLPDVCDALGAIAAIDGQAVTEEPPGKPGGFSLHDISHFFTPDVQVWKSIKIDYVFIKESIKRDVSPAPMS